jgi:hypothetical protein
VTDDDSAWLDSRRLRRADVTVAATASLFLVWSFVPVWFVFVPGGVPVEGFEFRVNAWHGHTVAAGVLAVLALAVVALRMAGREIRLGGRRGRVDLAAAAAAEVLTVLGLVFQPEFFDVAWGLYVGMGLGLLWVMVASRSAAAPSRTAIR